MFEPAPWVATEIASPPGIGCQLGVEIERIEPPKISLRRVEIAHQVEIAVAQCRMADLRRHDVGGRRSTPVTIDLAEPAFACQPHEKRGLWQCEQYVDHRQSDARLADEPALHREHALIVGIKTN